MRILLDTHVFLWMFLETERFSDPARQFLEDAQTNDFFVSYVCPWEASIKQGVGKLRLPEGPELFFTDRVRRAGYRHLPVDLRHVARVHLLPMHLRDPFDRLLVSQARIEDMTI